MSDTLEWRQLSNFPDYEFSELGEVRKLDGKPLKPSLSGNLYRVKLRFIDGSYNTEAVHRLIAKAFVPNPKNLPCVIHKKDSLNNCKDNLKWVSLEDAGKAGVKRKKAAKKDRPCGLDPDLRAPRN